MRQLLNFLVRLAFAAAVLVFAVSTAIAVSIAAVVWLVRSSYLRLTGRSAPRFEARVVMPRNLAKMHTRRYENDVTDVEPRTPRG